ncbi:MAG: Mov34/MPN/PAD-1 family protein, partial [Lacipirellulaceae bacterium]
MLAWRDAGETEIGGFGISSAEDLLLVEDLVLVEQQADWASVEFKDTAVADFYDSQVDRGRTPEQFARIWIHTHPGDSPRPSGTDEETFARVFGSCNWAVMFILAQKGASYARLQFGVG